MSIVLIIEFNSPQICRHNSTFSMVFVFFTTLPEFIIKHFPFFFLYTTFGYLESIQERAKKMLPKGIFHILNVMERGKRINIEEKRRKGGKRFSSDFP